MARYKKLLVAIDGSPSSMHALEESFKLSKEGILGVSVAPPFTVDLRVGGDESIQSLLREPCETALTKASGMAEVAGAQVFGICAMGQPHERIVDLSESEGCDLIVVGAKGMLSLEKALMGDTTAKVIGYSVKDVMVVPEKTAWIRSCFPPTARNTAGGPPSGPWISLNPTARNCMWSPSWKFQQKFIPLPRRWWKRR